MKLPDFEDLPGEKPLQTRRLLRMLAGAVALAIVCMALRILMLHWGALSYSIVRNGVVNALPDVLVIGSTLCASYAAIWLASGRRRLAAAIETTFFAGVIILLLLACVNYVAVRMLGSPLTYQWLYYADFLRSFTPRSALLSVLSWINISVLVAAILAWGVLLVALSRLLVASRGTRLVMPTLVAGLALTLSYVALAATRLDWAPESRGKATNPLVELVRTTIAAQRLNLSDVADPIPTEHPAIGAPDRELLPPGLSGASFDHVVVIVLESVGARYVSGYANGYDATPRIAAEARRTIAIDDVYAHVPHSSKTLFSLLTSRLPLLSHEADVKILARTPMPTLGDTLTQAGFKTALFMSGDLQFQAVDRFLDGRGFSHVADMRHIPCDKVHVNRYAEWEHMDSADDGCTADALSAWLKARAGERTFSIMWTGNTHHPYIPTQEPIENEFSLNYRQNRFIAAVRSSDAAVGRVLDGIEQEGLFGRTLVIILGDHGEAFGEHGRWGHGGDVYDEQVRVPLLLISDAIRGHQRRSILSGLTDLAPTILHTLGMPQPDDWDGRSLFSEQRPRRVLLFAPNNDMIVGFREGTRKYVLELSSGTTRVFDLAIDPLEKIDMADPGATSLIKRVFAGLEDRQRRQLENWRSAKGR